MAELISHKIQITVTRSAKGGQTDQFVESHTSVDNGILRILIHGKIHFLVDQAEYYRLVSNQGLVMAFGVTDGLLVRTLVGQLIPNLPWAPLLICPLFYPFDPVVGDPHRHPEIKANPSGGERSRQTGHSADILRDGDSRGLDFPDQHVRKREVSHRILVHSGVEIQFIVPEILSEPMIPVNHAGDPVEAETVQVIFLEPELAVGKEEPHHLILPVIKASGSPGRMMALRPRIEVQVVPSVEKSKSLSLVVHAVGVDNVHHHGYPHRMGSVDKFLELIRSAETGAQSEKV